MYDTLWVPEWDNWTVMVDEQGNIIERGPFDPGDEPDDDEEEVTVH